MNAKTKQCIDHKNGNRLDNRKKNLRFVTKKQNSQNKPKRANTTSKYIGVCLNSKCRLRPWAMHSKNMKAQFKFEDHAAYCYDVQALKLYGPEAKINGLKMPEGYIEPQKKTNLVLIHGKKAPGLTMRKNVHGYTYRIDMKIEGVRHHETFKNLEEATTKYLILKNLTQTIKITPTIPRNADGIALLACTNTTGILVDDDIYLRYHDRGCYLANGYPMIRENGQLKYLHALVAQPKENEICDHINRSRIDCRQSNLRNVDHTINAYNRSKVKNASSEYFGVSKSGNGFGVSVQKNYIAHRGGYYKNEQVAAWAADQLAHQLYGEYANTNNVQLEEEYEFINNRACKKLKN
jgi:hypothetical protein